MNKTKMAIEIFDSYAEEYQAKFMDVVLYKETLDLFCELIEKENASILDLACGPGNITKYILEKRPDFKVLGIDLSSNMIELAKGHNPTAEFQIMDIQAIGAIEQKKDAVICAFGLPYLSKEDSVKLIREVSKLLNPGGVFYISTMEEDEQNKSGLKGPSSGEGPKMYIHYHQAIYLTEALEANGFEIKKMSRQNYPGEGIVMHQDLIILARVR